MLPTLLEAPSDLWLHADNAIGTAAADYKDTHPYPVQLVEDAGTSAEHSRNFDILQSSGRWLLVGDFIALIMAFFCGGLCAWAIDIYGFKSGFQDLVALESVKESMIFGGLGGLALAWLDTHGHYRQRLPFWEITGHILKVTLIGFLIGGFIEFAAHNSFSRLWLGLSWVLFGFFLFTGRILMRGMLEGMGRWKIPALLIGDGPLAESVIRTLEREPELGFTLVRQLKLDGLRWLATPEGWKNLMHMHGASHIFLALEVAELQSAALKSLMRGRLPYSIIPPWTGVLSSTLSPHHFIMHDISLLHETNRLTLPLPCFMKRSFDIACAGAGLLLLAPFLAIVAFIVRSDGGPALFRQERVGRNGRKFFCYKFRSMHADAELLLSHHLATNPAANVEWQKFQKLKQDVRITPFGRFIRRKSIDELPQLINVLLGDMSLVGPRPIMPGQAEYYGEDILYYQSVRPGITGPWQVNGRNAVSFKERVALECCYARNWSLWMDIVILLKTLPVLFKKEQAF